VGGVGVRGRHGPLCHQRRAQVGDQAEPSLDSQDVLHTFVENRLAATLLHQAEHRALDVDIGALLVAPSVEVPGRNRSSQGVQVGGKALKIRHINGMEVRKKRPRGVKKRPRGFK
jgi:hypothetical protein